MIKGTIALKNDVSVEIETSDISQFLEVLSFVQGDTPATSKNTTAATRSKYGHPGVKNWNAREISVLLNFLSSYRGRITGRCQLALQELAASGASGKTVRTEKAMIQLLNAIDHYKRGDSRYLSKSMIRILNDLSGNSVTLHRDFGSMRSETQPQQGGRVHSLIDNFNEA